MAASVGFASKMAVAAHGTAIGSFSTAFEFVSENVQKQGQMVKTDGLRGTRQHNIERTRDSTYSIGGTINLHATPDIVDLWLPRIGFTETNDVWTPDEAQPDEFDLLIDRVAKRFLYTGCKVSRATFTSTAGGLLVMTLEIVGEDETVSDTAFPSITPPLDLPYVHSDGVLTISSSARSMMEASITIDNVVTARFTNSRAATDVHATDRVISFTCTTPYTSSETALHDQGAAGAAAATLVYTNGNLSLSFAAGRLALNARSPVVDSRGEIVLRSEGEIKGVSTTADLTITNDATP